MRYIKDGAIAADPWVRVEGDSPVPADLPAIISAGRLLAEGASVAVGRSAPLGVAWPNDKPVAEAAPHLPKLCLVALEFPAFRDGRAYTQARHLRERYGFAHEIRATGDVLRDQFLFMVRAGFNAFEVRKDADADAFAEALRQFTGLYQPAADRRNPVFRFRFSPAEVFHSRR